MPRMVTLEAHEVERITRVRIAEYLGKFPHEVDEMPYPDYMDMIAVIRADNALRDIARERNRLNRPSGKWNK